MATTYGAGSFGLPNDESGLILQSITYNYTNDKKEVRGRSGSYVGIAYFNERVEVGLEAVVPASGAFSSTLAATLVMTNSMPDFLQGSISGGSLLIEEISKELGAEEYQTISIKATYYPSISG